MSLSWRISGDAGDGVFQLALMHKLGGRHIVRCVDRPGVTSPWTPRVPLIKRLFEAQPYIEAVEISEEDVDIDLVAFRRWHSNTTTLPMANCAEYQMQTGKFLRADGSEPWLFVEADPSFSRKIIISRSPRYNNRRFPWKKIVDHYGPRLIFVGLREEHQAFVEGFGDVLYLPTPTLWEVARAIAGSALFIGNQSSPHAIALALGKDIISEVGTEQPDCIFSRENVQYVGDGECCLPDVSGSGELEIPPYIDIPASFNRRMVPPGFWQYKTLPPSTDFNLQVPNVRQLESCSMEEAEVKLFETNARRIPAFFSQYGTSNDPLHLFKVAMANAFPKEFTSKMSKTAV